MTIARKPPRLGPDFNPGGAFWCTEHRNTADQEAGRLECTKEAKRLGGGRRCHNVAVRGRDACTIHGGIAVQRARDLGEITITAWSALGKPGAGQQMEPGAAVLGMLQMSWLRAAYYGQLLREQATGQEPHVPSAADNAFDGDQQQGDEQTGGLIGYRWGAAGQDGVLYRQSEEVRALVKLESEERDRVVKYAKIAHDMGISDRLTSLAEKWGDMVATRITGMLDGLELTPEQQLKVPMLVESHLGSLDLTELGG